MKFNLYFFLLCFCEMKWDACLGLYFWFWIKIKTNARHTNSNLLLYKYFLVTRVGRTLDQILLCTRFGYPKNLWKSKHLSVIYLSINFLIERTWQQPPHLAMRVVTQTIVKAKTFCSIQMLMEEKKSSPFLWV